MSAFDDMKMFGYLVVALCFCGAGCSRAVPRVLVPEQPVACTMEAKLCPDGSAVGRVGPNCEFAPCPGEKVTSTFK